MNRRAERLLLLASGVGAEALLALMLPLLRETLPDGELATLALALTATAVGRNVGAFKIDTALTNARLDQLNALHRLAVAMALVSTALVAMAAAVLLQAVPPKDHGSAIAQAGAFFLGAAIQASSMRFLREGRIASYAWSKVGPVGILAAAIGLADGQTSLPWLWVVAAALCWVTCLALHASPAEGIRQDLMVGETLSAAALRKLVLVGTPGSMLDALNVYLMAQFVISLAGTQAAADAAALQRMVLGPAIALNLLSSQSLWRLDPVELSDVRTLSHHRTRLGRQLLFGTLATALWGAVLVWFALQQWNRSGFENHIRVACFLLPIMAQQLVSPYTVLLFKQGRVVLFAILQVALLAALAAAYAYWVNSPADWRGVLAVSVGLSLWTAAATVFLSRLKAK